jgi:hypothetical protein
MGERASWGGGAAGFASSGLGGRQGEEGQVAAVVRLGGGPQSGLCARGGLWACEECFVVTSQAGAWVAAGWLVGGDGLSRPRRSLGR